jgi:hypothetical protein
MRRLSMAMAVLVIAAGVGEVSACGPPASTSPDEKAARELGELKDRLHEVDQDIVAIQPEKPITLDSVREYVAEVEKELPRYVPIREDILAKREEVQNVDDPDVRHAADLLVEMVNQRYDGMRAFVRSATAGDFSDEALAALQRQNDQTNATNAEWAQVANRLNDRYGGD